MTFSELCQAIDAHAPYLTRGSRIIVLPALEEVRCVIDKYVLAFDAPKIHVSEYIEDNLFIPPPGMLLDSLQERIKACNAHGKRPIVWGLDALLAIWSNNLVADCASIVREMIDDANLKFLLIIREFDDTWRRVFGNPKYLDGEIVIRPGDDEGADEIEVTLLSAQFTHLNLSGKSFSSLRKYVEEYENFGVINGSSVNIFLNNKSWPLATSAHDRIRQIYNVGQVLDVYCGLDDNSLSEPALEWLYDRVCVDDNLPSNAESAIFHQIFPSGINKNTIAEEPRKINNANTAEREVRLWLLRKSLSPQSYLYYVLSDEAFEVNNFASCYVNEARNLLRHSCADEFAKERAEGIKAIDVSHLEGDLSAFVRELRDEATDCVLPWLNLDTTVECAELLRRYMLLESAEIPSIMLNNSPLLRYYMSPYQIGERELEQYFTEYRTLKLKNRVTEEFAKRAIQCDFLANRTIKRRGDVLRNYSDTQDKTALLVVDAMGAEYLPMIVAMADAHSINVEYATVVLSKLPTITRCNNIDEWPDERRLADIKALDGIAHNGEEIHCKKESWENIVAQLEVFEKKVFRSITLALSHYEHVIVTADHGSSRLAVLARKEGIGHEIRLSDNAKPDNSRYTEAKANSQCPEGVRGEDSGAYWVVEGYNYLSHRGASLSFETHGGLTREECLVPLVVLTKNAPATFRCEQNTDVGSAEIEEDEEFDL